MIYICEDCGAVFDEPKVYGSDESRGEGCPDCGSFYFDEAVECEECGKIIPQGDAYGSDHHLCMDCLMNHKYDLPTLLNAVEDVQDELEIPVLARYIMADDEIVDLIVKELERRLARATDKMFPSSVDFDATDFIKDYKTEIADYIGEEIEGNE